MKKVYVDLLFTSIPLGKTIDLIIDKIYFEGFCQKSVFKKSQGCAEVVLS